MTKAIAAADLDGVVILRRELLAEGYTDNQIQSLVRRGELHRVRHGSYVSGHLWSTLSASDRHRVVVRAVLKRAHPSTVATHISGAVERGAPVWGISLNEVHITRTDGKTGRRGRRGSSITGGGWTPRTWRS